MTVIVAVRDGTRVCMACDSQATNNGAKATLAHGKIVRYGATLFGCGDLTLMNAVRHAMPTEVGLSAMAMDVTQPLATWAACEFVPWLIEHLTKRGLMDKDSDGAAEFPGSIMLARGSEFVLVDKNTGIVEFAESYAASGSGMYDARGAMWALSHADELGDEFFAAHEAEAETLARAGVSAAIANDNGCGPPVCVEWTQP